MSITKQGEYFYGESQSDIKTVLADYSKSVAYIAEHFTDAVCTCGCNTFKLFIDDAAGAAIRICTNCDNKHLIGDSTDHLEEAELDECECPCGNGEFEVTTGVSLNKGSEDVKWLYIGCRCPKCGLTACYGDWNNEHENYDEKMESIQARVANEYPDGLVVYSAYSEDDNGLPVDNLDDVAFEGEVIFFSKNDPFYGEGKDFYSDKLANPTWMQVVGIANKAIARTGDTHHVFLEELADTGEVRDGATVVEIYFGS